MQLSKEDEAMASGKYGPGVEKAMKILIQYGEAFNAPRLVSIACAHVMPKEPIELLEEFTAGLTSPRVFTTTHPIMSAFSPKHWEKMGIDKNYALKEKAMHEKRVDIYKKVGINQTYTCMPMMAGNLPLAGQRVSFIGSGNQILTNSLIGARTNRDGTVINLCAAITGRAPELGFFVDENRHGQYLVNFSGIDTAKLSRTDIAAIGYYAGFRSGNYPVVIDGLSKGLGFDDLKGLVSLSTSGSTCLCHVVGVTPEAPDLKTALGGKKPKQILTIGKSEIRETYDMYRKATTDKVDMVITGCPHTSVEEARKIATILNGKKVGNNQRLWIGMGPQAYRLAQLMGYTDVIEEAGGVLAGACMSTIPDSPIPHDVKVVATNSFKIAHYVTGLQKGRIQVILGSLDECINASITGKIQVKD